MALDLDLGVLTLSKKTAVGDINAFDLVSGFSYVMALLFDYRGLERLCFVLIWLI